MIEFRQVTTGYGNTVAVKDITFHVEQGTITSLIGPNGSGKSTLLRAAVGQLPLWGGDIVIKGKSLSSYGRKELARTVAFMPQSRSVPSITVRGLVSHGRFPYLGLSRKMMARDKQAVAQAMEQTGVAKWADRDLRALSGGERQRAYLAMALAQDTDVIFLDEPATYLDISHQFELLELIRALNRQGKTIVMVLHDLGHALSCSHNVALLYQGCLAACESPRSLYQSGEIDRIFQVCTHQVQGSYYFTARSRAD